MIGGSGSRLFKLMNGMSNVRNVGRSGRYVFIIGGFGINMSKIGGRIGMSKVKRRKLVCIMLWGWFD